MTADPGGVYTAVLSGAGTVIYAATGSNRLIEISTADGSVTQLTNRTPEIRPLGSGDAPGSLVQFSGSGLAGANGQVSLQVGGLSAPVVGFNGNSGYLQVPWEAPLSDPEDSQLTLTVGAEPDSLFEQGATIGLTTAAPAFFPSIAHHDFHGPVTSADPAAPGEVLHFYLSGLGPVSPSIPTGTFTPTGILYRATNPPVCTFNYSQLPASLSFVGLAPGLLGTYQIDTRVPEGLSGLSAVFSCLSFLPAEELSDAIQVPLSSGSPSAP